MARLMSLLGLGFALLAGPVAADPAPPAGQVFKSATCDCCTAWMAHMSKAGFALEGKDMANKDLHRFKVHVGLKPGQESCHTALIEGYVIEGHVPADDVRRLLQDRPDAIGLTVPGMPIGSPGMETGDPAQPFEVLLVKKDGTTEVFARH